MAERLGLDTDTRRSIHAQLRTAWHTHRAAQKVLKTLDANTIL